MQLYALFDFVKYANFQVVLILGRLLFYENLEIKYIINKYNT